MTVLLLAAGGFRCRNERGSHLDLNSHVIPMMQSDAAAADAVIGAQA